MQKKIFLIIKKTTRKTNNENKLNNDELSTASQTFSKTLHFYQHKFPNIFFFVFFKIP